MDERNARARAAFWRSMEAQGLVQPRDPTDERRKEVNAALDIALAATRDGIDSAPCHNCGGIAPLFQATHADPFICWSCVKEIVAFYGDFIRVES